MSEPIFSYWQKRLGGLKAALEANNFDVFMADSAADAREVVVKEILPGIEVKSVSWGGSKTLMATGLCDYFKGNDAYEVLDTFDRTISREDMLEKRRQALLTDLFVTGTNAVTESGQLVNLDMIGNRVGAITFGPKHVIILLGRNKLTADLEGAMTRIKTYAAPVNTMRLGMKTPCVKTATCEECRGPQRICNTWTITEKSFPKGRVKIVLINEDLGF
jgi:L-lactate utilization protein LutB